MPNKFKLPEGVDFTFETERLLFRPLNHTDNKLYHSLYTDEKTMKLIAPPFNKEKADKAFKATINAMKVAMSHQRASTMTWVLTYKETDTRIGIMALNWQAIQLRHQLTGELINSPENIPEIGIILSRFAHGKNIPFEAGGGLLEFGFKALRLKRINTFYNNANIPVKRFIEKLGMIRSPYTTKISGQSIMYAESNWYLGKAFIV